MRNRSRRSILALLVPTLLAAAAPAARADQVIPDDLIVQASECVGIDCVDGESFGFDTIRMKENNTRLAFDDTSTNPGAPARDWTLVANEPAPVGAETRIDMFAIQDTSAGRIPFLLEGAAPANSLRVDTAGNVGFGTDDPAFDLHVRRDDTPGIRLDQGGGAFGSQVWDVAGNEANFFVRDLTGGSKLSFRIRPGAPTSSVDIGSTGNVGMGTPSPTEPLHVQRGNGTAKILVEEDGGSGDQTLLDLSGKTSALAHFGSSDTGASWLAGASQSGAFAVSGGAGGERRLTVDPGGELSVAGSVSQLADAAEQENVTPANPTAVMDALRNLPISTYEYVDDSGNGLHLGPTALDFASGFGIGGGSFVGVGDMAGVSLVAAKELDRRVRDLEGTIATDTSGLAARVESLESRLAAANASAAQANRTARKAMKLVKKLKKRG